MAKPFLKAAEFVTNLAQQAAYPSRHHGAPQIWDLQEGACPSAELLYETAPQRDSPTATEVFWQEPPVPQRSPAPTQVPWSQRWHKEGGEGGEQLLSCQLGPADPTMVHIALQ